MKTRNNSKPDTTGHNLEICQVSAKTPRRNQVRSGQTTAAYWKARLYRNTYKDRDGNTVFIPEFYVRIHHDGTTKQVRLTNSNRDDAADEALSVFLSVREQGWNVVTSKQARLPASPTIAEFCESYRLAAASMERSPRDVSIRLYCRCLKQLCGYAGVKEIRQLTREAVERARDAYRAEARENKRPDSAIQNTVTKVIRNAKACFSREALAIMARKGFRIDNPFDGIKLTQEIQPVFSLDEMVVKRIWDELPLLRDGDPHATDPTIRPRKRARVQIVSTAPTKIDFRHPHPASYAAVLLALGFGLRANEIDKARWSWFGFNAKGEGFLSIKEESDFKPKGGSARILKIQNAVYDALIETRTDLASPYILGGQTNSSDTVTQGESYRCVAALQTANAWLRARGIEAEKRRGNPLHRLRKQFGSEVATGFGLFAAQKLLGHSSPIVTAKYYAAQTELPTLTHVHIAG